MRRRSIIVLSLLFLAGCEPASKRDAATADAFVRRHYNNVAINYVRVDPPEYANVVKIPDSHRDPPAGTPAACAVRVRFQWRDDTNGTTTTTDDWVVWVNRDHQAFDFSRNGEGDKWREWVRASAAQK